MTSADDNDLEALVGIGHLFNFRLVPSARNFRGQSSGFSLDTVSVQASCVDDVVDCICRIAMVHAGLVSSHGAVNE
ncbi:hypothetical protein H310_14022 [Aphanomyces invadans]|uniref:Uncharacterized protein n=1 Tax=Aphanomyces invadans TaxID=157072 RepID=A0A024TBU1_9STRA|nr:hypothetical protein H310_14022 [Aphanomyces invadans]ETV91503.1 hypothetical protein H310_14022 [Aphanomyces invadans]|eukprot:XP_008879955.1 hypothetical protein H310_14022 [Aphanomyces invadans]